MAQRGEAPDSLDHFPTPPWATRALCTHVIDIAGCAVWEPACAEGRMAEPLKEFAQSVRASDVHDYGYGEVLDFLWPARHGSYDWVITNPPFLLAEQFVHKGLLIATRGVAVLVRTAFIEGQGRYASLFKDRPPTIMAQFVERVPMVKGRLDADASTATSYCWLVWLKFWAKPTLMWIPPCRAKLTCDGDYT